MEFSRKSISDPSNLYFVRSYIENLLGYNSEAMKSQLSTAGVVLDSTQDNTDFKGTYSAAVTGPPADPEINRFRNQDQTKRSEWIKSMSPLQLSRKIHCDLFQQDKPLIPGVSLSIKLVRARNMLTFTTLTSAGVPRAVIRKPKVFVR